MNIISPLEIFIALFIGMGPVKVLLVYLATTKNMDPGLRKKVASRIVIVAGSVAVGLFIVGAAMRKLLQLAYGVLRHQL